MKRDFLTNGSRLLLKACALSMVLFLGASCAGNASLLDTLSKNNVISEQQREALSQAGAEEGNPGALLDVLGKNGTLTKEQYGILSQYARKARKSKIVEVDEPGSYGYDVDEPDPYARMERILLLDTLLNNGTITKDQYSALSQPQEVLW